MRLVIRDFALTVDSVLEGNIDSADNDHQSIKQVELISDVMLKALPNQLRYKFDHKESEESQINLFKNHPKVLIIALAIQPQDESIRHYCECGRTFKQP